MAFLHAELEQVLAAASAGQVAILKLDNIEFIESVDVRTLLDSSNAKADKVIPCPFAWKVTKCTFLEGFSAVRVHFQQDVDFGRWNRRPSEQDCVQFLGPQTDFSGARFSGENTYFSRAIFSSEQTSFRKAQFSKNNTYFNGAQFSRKKTDFKQARFSGESTYFSRAIFSGEETNFSETQFSGENLYFGSCQLQNSSRLTFESVQFSGKSRLIIENWKFDSAAESACLRFQNWGTHDQTERLVIRNDQLTVVTSEEKEAEYPKRYQFQNCSLRSGTVMIGHLDLNQLHIQGGNGISGFNFEQCHWPTHPVHGRLGKGLKLRCSPIEAMLNVEHSRLHQQMLDYARLKEKAKEQGDAQLACQFHFWQMWNRYHSLSWWNVGDWWEKPVLCFYLLTSAFGLSIVRPLFWLMFNYFSFGSYYTILISSLASDSDNRELIAYYIQKEKISTSFFNFLCLFDVNWPIYIIALALIGVFAFCLPCIMRFYSRIKSGAFWILSFFEKLFLIMLRFFAFWGFIFGVDYILSLYPFWEQGMQLSFVHSSPLESFELEETLKTLLGYAEKTEVPPWGSSLGFVWHFWFWLGFTLQNAIGLYLLFQFGAAIRNKVRQ